jgi:hypothetical protein
VKKPPGQFSLFDAPPAAQANAVHAPAPAPSTPPAARRFPSLVDIRGERTKEWEYRVTSHGFKPKPRIMVSRDWTGVVVEDLSHPQLGRQLLYRDGLITEIARDSAHYLTIFMTAENARALHIFWPLVPLSVGNGGALFRLAEPGEDAPITLKLPEGM